MTRTPTALDQLSDEWMEILLEHEPEWHVELGRPGREGSIGHGTLRAAVLGQRQLASGRFTR